MRKPSPLVIALLLGCSSSEPPMIPRLAPGPAASTSSAVSGDPPACVHEGDEIAQPPASGPIACCDGLVRVPVFKGSVLRLDQCYPVGGGRAMCVRCGDGFCGIGENACDCPADCH
jgi:hypothetical protein